MAQQVETSRDHDEKGRFYTFFVDDREFHVDDPTITGGQIMDLAGIPRDVGLILKPGRRFKKAPRFKRG